MHHKRDKPRTKSRSIGAFPDGAPAAWNILFHSRPRRRRDRARLSELRRGGDPDSLVWELGNRRPHIYYW